MTGNDHDDEWIELNVRITKGDLLMLHAGLGYVGAAAASHGSVGDIAKTSALQMLLALDNPVAFGEVIREAGDGVTTVGGDGPIDPIDAAGITDADRYQTVATQLEAYGYDVPDEPIEARERFEKASIDID